MTEAAQQQQQQQLQLEKRQILSHNKIPALEKSQALDPRVQRYKKECLDSAGMGYVPGTARLTVQKKREKNMNNEDGHRIHKIKEEAGEKEITEQPSKNGRNNELLTCPHKMTSACTSL